MRSLLWLCALGLVVLASVVAGHPKPPSISPSNYTPQSEEADAFADDRPFPPPSSRKPKTLDRKSKEPTVEEQPTLGGDQFEQLVAPPESAPLDPMLNFAKSNENPRPDTPK